MGDTRDPETDQPAPKPGGYPVQAVLIEALKQRMAFGLKKYGRPLETDNGRNPLLDMWEEMLDMVSYFTQYVLEQGVELPGLEMFTKKPESEPDTEDKIDAMIRLGRLVTPAEMKDVCAFSQADPEICPQCRHDPHEPGHCQSQALNLGCGCLGR